MAPSPVHIVTNLSPTHLLTVSFGPLIGRWFETALPFRSYRTSFFCSWPLKTDASEMISILSVCLIVEVSRRLDIMPTFLLLAGLNSQTPVKSVGAAGVITTSSRIRIGAHAVCKRLIQNSSLE